MPYIEAIILDWGDTVMVDFLEFDGPMASWPRVAMVPGVDVALSALHGRYPLALASNAGDSDAVLIGQALERAGLRHYFGDHLYASRELGARKPEPAFFLGVVQRLGFTPGTCVMVGNDYDKDIAGAAAAGLRTIWLAPPGSVPRPAADIMITAMDALPGAIAQLAHDKEFDRS